MSEIKNRIGFGGIENPGYCDFDSSKVVFLPVPYDRTTTWVKGSDSGPYAIIQASKHMELYDIETDSLTFKVGFYTEEALFLDNGTKPNDMVKTVEKKVSNLIKKEKFVVTLGGEHSVSIGSIKAHIDNYPEASILQLDAHSDLRNEYGGSKYNHACVMARVKEFTDDFFQVGIRSMDSSEKEKINKEKTYLAKDIHNNTEWIDKIIDRLSDKVYLTIDLDVFDPSIMPSTGTPEPGGLLWYDVTAFLKEIAKRKEIVGFDVVELCPNEENKAPDFLAAKLIYKILSYKFFI